MTALLAIGADVEEFVVVGGRVGSAIGIIGGYKDEPRLCKYGNLQEDNVLAEYAIDPCTSEDSFVEHIQGIRVELLNVLGCDLLTAPVHEYTRDELISFGSNALRFGCSYELNAWDVHKHVGSWSFTHNAVTEDVIDRLRVTAPSPYTELRTAGGHVHFSYNDPDDAQTLAVIKTMDYLLGMWSVINDSDRRRRSMYGKAGYCRIKPYGGEYRTLSNFWVQSEEMVRTVYRLTQAAVQNPNVVLLSTVCSGDEVQRIINEYDVASAQRVFAEATSLLNIQL